MSVVTLQGPMQRTNVGQGGYSVAVGYDPGDGIVSMVGYMSAPAGDYSEGTNIQDEQHLVQTASPNSSDRYTRYPQATQGDWSEGGRQLIFENPSEFFISQGMDTTTPGLLQTRPSAEVITTSIGTPGSPPSFPAATDGDHWVVGLLNTGTSHNCFIGSAGTPLGAPASIGNGNNPEIYALLRTPLGIFAGTSAGIYLVNFTTPNASTLWTADVVRNDTYDCMAYFSEVAGGGLFYIKGSDGNIYLITAAGGPITNGPAHPAMEQQIAVICSYNNGILYICSDTQQAGATPTNMATMYVFNGQTSSYIGTFAGIAKAAVEVNGAVFFLAILDQPTGNGNYTLWEFAQGSINIVDDLRFDAPDFQEALASLPLSPTFKPSLKADGRFVYIGHQGMPGQMLDPYGQPPAITGTQTANFTHYVGRAAPTDTEQDTRVILPTSSAGVLDVYASITNGIVSVQAYRGPADSGYLITSYFDFGVPTVNKLFNEFDVTFTQRQDPRSLQAQFRTDDNQIWTNAVVLAGPGNVLRVVPPEKTIGSRIQWKIISDNTFFTVGIPWTIRFYTVHGKLPRIWNMTLACRTDMETFWGVPDAQRLSGRELWANLMNAERLAGGNVYLYVSDPTDPFEDGSFTDTVAAHIEDMTATAAGGKMPAARQTQDTSFDLERDVKIQFVEDLTDPGLLH